MGYDAPVSVEVDPVRAPMAQFLLGCSVVVVLMALSSLTGCESRDQRDAAAFVKLFKGVSIGAPPEVRVAQVDELEAFPTESKTLARLKDDCVAGHRAMLEAEKRAAEAQQAFEIALAQEAGNADSAPLSEAAREALERTIEGGKGAVEQSNASIARARRLLEGCNTGVMKLSLSQ